MDVDDAGMLEAGQHAGFLQEAVLGPGPIGRQRLALGPHERPLAADDGVGHQLFDGHLAAQAAVDPEVGDAKAALAENTGELVVFEPVSGGER